jgi:hypothetical protein
MRNLKRFYGFIFSRLKAGLIIIHPVIDDYRCKAIDTGAAHHKIDPERIARHTREFIYDERLSLI